MPPPPPYKKPYTIGFGDIDNFKMINDTYGHCCGDFVLKEAAHRMACFLRESDHFCRWGGEEFVLFLSVSDLDEGRQIIQRIKNAVAETPFLWNGESLDITITYGIAPSSEGSLFDVINKADKNMYLGKKSGKNIIVG